LLVTVNGFDASNGRRFPHDGEFNDALIIFHLVSSLQFKVVNTEFRAVDLHLYFEVAAVDELGSA
jgi:hypothetical protein